MSAAVETDRLGRDYGAAVAVDELTFTAQAGEILGFLGPNGAGKTTAIRVLTTILEPSRGSFSVGGIPHTQPVDIRRRIGVLPESAGYQERQTGEEFLRYHARLYGQSRAGARSVARALLEDVGLSDRRDSLVGSYSRGMRQRLGIARALVNEPRVVFLDEPTLGLDPAGQRLILGAIVRIATERGAAVLLSTHLLAEVEETCSRVLILNRGRIAAQGTVSELAARAAAPRTARLSVAPEDTERALAVLAAARGVEGAAAIEGQPGWLRVTLDTDGGGGVDPMNEGLRSIVEAGIRIRSFELEGARLSDAFLAMTRPN